MDWTGKNAWRECSVYTSDPATFDHADDESGENTEVHDRSSAMCKHSARSDGHGFHPSVDMNECDPNGEVHKCT